METPPSSRPSAAWATDLIDRYRFNPFYRTTTHVILLQVALALVSIVLFVSALEHVQDRTVSVISQQISAALADGATTTPGSISESIDAVEDRIRLYAFLGVLLLNVLFGFLIARFALWPTRNSLQFQKRFIGNVAHEIRTPLAIIKTNTEVALFDPKLPPGVKATFEEIVVELDRISETINNLLSFDTLTRPRRMQFEPTDLGDIVETVIARHGSLAESRGVRLSADIGSERLVQGNGVALDQVVTNLVKNAINYTPADQDGKVTVSVGPADARGKVTLAVADTGIGIGEKDLFHIFEPFYRGDSSRARGVGTGTSGLGLAIVNEIVRLHKGSVTIRSAPGKGTEIRVTLPCPHDGTLFSPFEGKEKGGANEISVDFS